MHVASTTQLMAVVTTALYRMSNYIECALWIAVGGLCLLPVLRIAWTRTERIVAALVFIAFGVSDYVESHTGAWWDPWWLLLWKAACVAIILALASLAWRRRRDHTHRDS